MLNNTNKNIALAISKAYCAENEVCKNSLFQRLLNFLDDTTFPEFLTFLTSRRYEVAHFNLPFVYQSQLRRWVGSFHAMDLISGTNQVFPFTISSSYYDPNNTDWKKVIENINEPFIKFVKVIGSDVLYNTTQHGGYNIAYTIDPIISGGGSGGGVIDPGKGKVIVIDPFKPEINGNTKIVDVENIFTGGFENYLIPAAVVLGIYLMVRS